MEKGNSFVLVVKIVVKNSLPSRICCQRTLNHRDRTRVLRNQSRRFDSSHVVDDQLALPFTYARGMRMCRRRN